MVCGVPVSAGMQSLYLLDHVFENIGRYFLCTSSIINYLFDFEAACQWLHIMSANFFFHFQEVARFWIKQY